MNEKVIKRLKNDPYFKQFQKFVLEKIDDLNSISDLKDMTINKAGETVKVRAVAASKLYEILTPFLDFREKREPTIKEVKKAKDRAGLS